MCVYIFVWMMDTVSAYIELLVSCLVLTFTTTDEIRETAHFSYKARAPKQYTKIKNILLHKSILNGTFVWSSLCGEFWSVQKELKYIRILHIHKIKTILHLFGWAYCRSLRIECSCVYLGYVPFTGMKTKWQNHKRNFYWWDAKERIRIFG